MVLRGDSRRTRHKWGSLLEVPTASGDDSSWRSNPRGFLHYHMRYDVHTEESESGMHCVIGSARVSGSRTRDAPYQHSVSNHSHAHERHGKSRWMLEVTNDRLHNNPLIPVDDALRMSPNI